MQNIIYYIEKLEYIKVRQVNRGDCTGIRHINYTFNILLAIDGNMKIEINNIVYLLDKGSIVIINPFDEHKCIEVNGDDIFYYVLEIDFEYYKKLQFNLMNKNVFINPVVNIISDIDLYNNLLKLVKLFIVGNNFYLKIHHTVNLLLIDIIENYKLKVNLIEDIESINKIFEFIKINYKYNISIEDIAKSIYKEKKYVISLFRNVFRQPPYKFIISYRLHQAKKMLDNNYKLNYIANEVGFYDQSHFHRYFVEHFGITPKLYKKSINYL